MSTEPAAQDAAATGGPGLGLAFACLGAAAILLVVVAKNPPLTLCDPSISMATLGFAAAQAAFLVALASARRRGVSSLLAVVLPLAWCLLAGAVLVLRQSAGDVDALRGGDALFAGASVLGLFLMFHGMAMRIEKAGIGAWLVACALAFGLSLGWIAIMDETPRQRMWRSWQAVNDFNDAVMAFREKTGGVPQGAGTIEEVAAKLDAALAARVPRVDGWGRPLEYISDGKTYELASRGAFGDRGPHSAGPVNGFADDLVITDGNIVSLPETPCGSASAAAAKEANPLPATEAPPELPTPEGAIDKRHDHRRR